MFITDFTLCANKKVDGYKTLSNKNDLTTIDDASQEAP
jgi:hypothetical protein